MTDSSRSPNESDLQLLHQADLVAAAGEEAVREAVLDHKRTGHPIVVGDTHGNVRWIPPEQIDDQGRVIEQ